MHPAFHDIFPSALMGGAMVITDLFIKSNIPARLGVLNSFLLREASSNLVLSCIGISSCLEAPTTGTFSAPRQTIAQGKILGGGRKTSPEMTKIRHKKKSAGARRSKAERKYRTN